MKNLDRLAVKLHEQYSTNSSKPKTKTSKGANKKPGSKRHDLKRLPEGWNDAIFEIQHPQWMVAQELRATNPTIALAFLQSSGARPDELEKGVTFFMEDNEVVVEIVGSKQIKDANGKAIRGIEKRWLTINPNFCKAAEFLCRFVKHQIAITDNPNFKFSYKKSTFKTMMVSLSDRYHDRYRSNKAKISVTTYFFRHHMSASLKSCKDLSASECAMVMGHLSTESLKSYASGYKKKSPVRPVLSVRTTEVPMQKIQSSFIASKTNLKQPTTSLTYPIRSPARSGYPSI
jgi:hypothetical protein